MIAQPKAIVLDIEGTTSSIAFVADTLFPYARRHLRDFVEAHGDTVEPLLMQVRAAGDGEPVDTLLQWMDEDSKATPLKTLQGMIWARGYEQGILKGHIYSDAADALRRWRAGGIPVFIYSSGSVAAQRLLFAHSVEGDLTPLLAGYFDTTTGPKRDAASYAAIAARIGMAPDVILFVSDTMPEVAAARSAGLAALHINREGDGGDIREFGEIGWGEIGR